jgi:hypothetical protein
MCYVHRYAFSPHCGLSPALTGKPALYAKARESNKMRAYPTFSIKTRQGDNLIKINWIYYLSE